MQCPANLLCDRNSINDYLAFLLKIQQICEDGRVLYPVTVWLVKDPSESKGRWDYYKPIRTISPAEAFLPMLPEKCAFLKK